MTKRVNFSSDWLILFVVIIASLTTTIIMNLNHVDDGVNKVEGTISADNGDQKINWDRYRTTNVVLDQTLEIKESGIYHLTGNLSDGLINISVGDEGVVKLILDNASITNSNGPAIACYSADDLVIELIGENNIKDSANYSTDLDEDVKGAIYSKADLTFSGDGKLIIEANHEDGIVSKDDLKIAGGVYQIAAKDDGIRGKDSVYITDGIFNIEAESDTIKSTNETDDGKGFVLIENGEFNLTASAKGIKAINSILIHGGIFEIDSYDDAIHSNNYIGINGGDIKISSGDDGIHADRELIIDGGDISISKSYEGLEAQKITISSGEIAITSSDDGINAGGGSDGSANNRPGAGAFNVDENCEITIGGGNITINASGDGIDSNGAIHFDDGKVIVDGPTNNGNGALDVGSEAYINGGEVVAVGSSGMAVALSSNSSVFNLSVYFSSTYEAGTTLTIKDSTDQTIISHTSRKPFSHATIGSDKFALDKTYTIYINDSIYQTFTISDITTTLGKNQNNFNNNFRR